jgi:hypothetical protein
MAAASLGLLAVGLDVDVDLLDRFVLRRVVGRHLWVGCAEGAEVGAGGPEAVVVAEGGAVTQARRYAAVAAAIAAGMFFSAISISVRRLRASA